MVIKVESVEIVWNVYIGNVVKSKASVKFISIYICKFTLVGWYIFIVNPTQYWSHARQVQVISSGKYVG
jgi:uncharacterized membrane protein